MKSFSIALFFTSLLGVAMALPSHQAFAEGDALSRTDGGPINEGVSNIVKHSGASKKAQKITEDSIPV